MKKLFYALFAFSLVLTACGGSEESNDGKKIGLVVTSEKTLEDKSFTEGMYNGMKEAADEHGMDAKYDVAANKTTADYENSFATLADTGYEVLFSAGFEFVEAVGSSSKQYPDVNFIIIDEFVEGDNVTSVLFAEEQGGFIAGVAAALSSETGKVAFVGGMQIPPVERYAWGFEAGVMYANAELGTNVEITDVVYEGSFDNVQGGASIGAGIYDKGADIIMHAAGGVGVGIIQEAKEREGVFVIGVDVDQYEDGLKQDGTSVILTSSLKRVDSAVVDILGQIEDGSFKGGQTYTGDVTTGGIAIPEENPNLDSEVEDQVNDVIELLKDGTVVAPKTKEELDSFLK